MNESRFYLIVNRHGAHSVYSTINSWQIENLGTEEDAVHVGQKHRAMMIKLHPELEEK